MSLFLNLVLVAIVIWLLYVQHRTEKYASFIAGRERIFTIHLMRMKQIKDTEVGVLRTYNYKAYVEGNKSARRDLGEI